jgi:hypothetical protein
LAETWVVRARALAAWATGARAGSLVVPPWLAEMEHGAAIALQHWRPDCVDEGDDSGVSGLRRWQLVGGKLA